MWYIYTKMAASRIDIDRHPYGLSGGYIMSGSCSGSFTTAFQYLPITATSAIIITELPQNAASPGGLGITIATSSLSSSAWTVGQPISAPITQITQSSGLAIVYLGVAASAPRI